MTMTMLRKLIFVNLLALAALALPLDAARAACGDGASTCWWTGGGANANWNTTGNWSNSSGGASNGTSPANGDSVCFDNASTTFGTINATRTITNLDTTGTEAFCTAGGSASAYLGAITHSAAVTLTVNGAIFNISSSTGWTAANATTSAITFGNTSGTTTITPNSSGASRNLGNITINGSGATFNLGSNITGAAGSTFTHTAGNFDASGFDVSYGLYEISNTANARTFTCGSGTITATGTSGSVWNVGTGGSLTVSCNAGSVVGNAGPTSSRTFNFGGRTYNNVTVTANAHNGYPVVIGGSSTNATFANLTLSNLGEVYFNNGSMTWTITNSFTYNGTSTNPGLLMAGPNAMPGGATITLTNNATLNWVALGGITETAGNGTLTVNSGFNLGNNALSGGAINPPSSGGGARPLILGGG